jgi:hypothetical protein
MTDRTSLDDLTPKEFVDNYHRNTPDSLLLTG